MRNSFLLLALFCVIGLSAQDKIYLNDNSVVNGKIIDKNKKSVVVRSTDLSERKISTSDIAIIIYESGYSEASDFIKIEKKEFEMAEWMIGTNILQPLEGFGGIMIEKNFGKRYSLRVSQAFYISRYYGFGSRTSVLNNFYIGKGRVKWINSIGANITYDENNYFGCFPTAELLVMDYFAPYPQQGFHSQINIGLSYGTGVYVDITRHLGFSTQIQFNLEPYSWGWYHELDINNAGFSFFYKF